MHLVLLLITNHIYRLWRTASILLFYLHFKSTVEDVLFALLTCIWEWLIEPFTARMVGMNTNCHLNCDKTAEGLNWGSALSLNNLVFFYHQKKTRPRKTLSSAALECSTVYSTNFLSCMLTCSCSIQSKHCFISIHHSW